MIRFSLTCSNGHGFESWFQSTEAYDKLLSATMIACPDCGDTAVEKAIMAPRVRTGRQKAAAPANDTEATPLTTPQSDKERALAELKAQVEANSDYVGMNFAAEARKMHDGEVPTRSIYGEAKPDDAKKLIEDGVPVAPLPFTPRSKSN